MTPTWAAWVLTVGIAAILGVGLYLFAWHRGYVAGRLRERLAASSDVQDWTPPSEAEFMAELLEHRRQNAPPERYRLEM